MPTTFHAFPLLPSELRIKIWQHALPPPRIIELRTNDRHSFYPAFPVLYAVSHEARAIILDSYTALTVPQLRDPALSSTAYLDLARDTLHIDHGHDASQLHEILRDSGAAHHLRHLALDWRIWNDVCEDNTYRSVFLDLALLPRLEELTFTIAEPYYAPPDPDIAADGVYGGIAEFVRLEEEAQRRADEDVGEWVEHFGIVMGRCLERGEGWGPPRVTRMRGVRREGLRVMGKAEWASWMAEELDEVMRGKMMQREVWRRRILEE